MLNRIGIVTVGRSDFGLLHPLIIKLKNYKKIKTTIFAAGGHFSNFSGNTIDEVKKLKIKIDYKIYCSSPDDSKHSVSLSFSEALKQFSQKFIKSKINSIVLLGDRYEMFAAAIAACNLGIKIFHIGGGCTTLGAIDNKYRFSISYLSDYHFVDLFAYKKKLMNIGISSNNIFNTGSLGAINVKSVKKKSLKSIENELKIKLNKKIILFTYHTTTLYTNDDVKFVNECLNYFKNKKEYKIIISNPNEDHSRKKITNIYNKFKRFKNFIFVKNLGYENYANLLNYAKFMIGNSSSGIIEAASYNLPVLNLGKRQKGRLTSKNVMNIENYNKKRLIKKLNFFTNVNFKIKKIKNIYLNSKSYNEITKKIAKLS